MRGRAKDPDAAMTRGMPYLADKIAINRIHNYPVREPASYDHCRRGVLVVNTIA